MAGKTSRWHAFMTGALLFSGLSTPSFAAVGPPPADNPLPVADKARLQTRALCSCIFVQGRPMGNCLDSRENIYQYFFTQPQRIPSSPDQALKISVRGDASLVQIEDKGQVLAQAVHLHDGGGCVTINPGDRIPAAATEAALPPVGALPRARLPSAVDPAWLDEQLDTAFSPAGPIRGYSRGIMIVQDGKVVAERYAPGFGPHNLYYSGSISKMFDNMLAGLLVADGKLDVREKITPPEWAGIKDDRRKISFDDMLFFVSGLDWEEDFFTAGKPAYNVYFAGPESLNSARYMTTRPLEAAPGTHYEYNTGGSTLLARELQVRIGTGHRADRAATLAYLHAKLLDPIGARRIVPEFDAAGNLMAGQGAYGAIEEWARIGELYRHDGVWDGKRIFPAGWIAYSTELRKTADPAHPYGANLMLNHVAPGCFGHTGVGGSRLIVCPDRKLTMIWMSSDFDMLGYADAADRIRSYDALTALQRSIIERFPIVGNPGRP
jgi:CubicO group peptidase (beta-lactamase class C family)